MGIRKEIINFTPIGIEQTFSDPIWLIQELTPENLVEVNPDYRQFRQVEDLTYIRETLPKIEGKKAIIAILGPSTAGKSETLRVVNKLVSEIEIIQTSTTRPPRENEPENAYHFLSEAEFAQLENDGDFIESVDQGNQKYGTQKFVVKQKLEGEKPILIWPGELQGVINFKQWMAIEYPDTLFLIVFMLPNISFVDLASRIGSQRDLNEALSWRIEKALWEIKTVGDIADIVILNPNDSTSQPKKLIKAFNSILCNIIGELKK